MTEIRSAVAAVVHPTGADVFTIYPERMGNGVKPIKDACIAKLRSFGWLPECNADCRSSREGAIDAVKPLGGGRCFAFEWETGNISSSHRALNKMVLGIMAGKVIGGMLVLPTRELYKFLTDRVGNYEELVPYFPVWRALKLTGVLGVIAVQHDATSTGVPKITKGTDGRALV